MEKERSAYENTGHLYKIHILFLKEHYLTFYIATFTSGVHREQVIDGVMSEHVVLKLYIRR